MAKSATMGAAFSKTRRCASYCRQLFLFFLNYFTFFLPQNLHVVQKGCIFVSYKTGNVTTLINKLNSNIMTASELKSILENYGLHNLSNGTCIRVVNGEIEFFNCGANALEDFEICIDDICFYVFEERFFEWDNDNLEYAAKMIASYIERSEDEIKFDNDTKELTIEDTVFTLQSFDDNNFARLVEQHTPEFTNSFFYGIGEMPKGSKRFKSGLLNGVSERINFIKNSAEHSIFKGRELKILAAIQKSKKL